MAPSAHQIIKVKGHATVDDVIKYGLTIPVLTGNMMADAAAGIAAEKAALPEAATTLLNRIDMQAHLVLDRLVAVAQ